MPDILFNNRYRISSSRLPCWDYGKSGWYFVTICTQDRNPFFGEIVGGTMRLSPMGLVVRRCWAEIPKHFPNAQLDESVIMPDHMHGIIISIGSSDSVETQNLASLPITHNTFGTQSRNLASIIRGYKIGVTKWARSNGHPFFMWQSRYHDRVIRDESAMDALREYIRNNPMKSGLNRSV